MLLAADAARESRGAGEFGVRTGEVTTDGAAVMRRVHAVRDRFLESMRENLARIPAELRLDGAARFTGPTTLRVGDDLEVRARAVVIAVGAHPIVAKPLEPVKDLVLTHESVFDLHDLPSSLAVVGAGAVGVELALAFARLGVRTTLFDKGSSLGGLKDPEVAEAARRLIGAELDLKLEVEIEARPDPQGARLSWRGEGGEGEAVFARVLAAAGRLPSVEGLDLDRSGLELDEAGVPKFDPATLRCGSTPVFLAGDVTTTRPVLHEAHDEGSTAGRGAARLALGRGDPPERPPTPLYGLTFTDPDMAAVGATMEELGDEAVVGRSDYDAGRASLEGREPGVIRLYGRRGGRTVEGGEMVGPAVEHLSHLLAGWVQERIPIERLLDLAFYHPTYEEDLQAALRDLARELDAPAG